ncbi:tumor necrosis factor ligand superfamily member 15 [Notechis scutatus]|uniref:Tumor necrosis factor ligand superfamily member 15 n=1 Tax=Notechis scutatus TaxID=8663 RepID=A0A6J1VGE0_9SAUR|nr:tumor necrosis factor ligand superfamily member 15 [Notechis scutatus]
MPFGELRSASGSSGGGGGCDRCGRCCKKREVRALHCLCGLGFLGMFLLALPVLYLIRDKVAEKAAPEEIPMERMPAAQKQQGNPPCPNCYPTTRPSVHARVNSKVSRTTCVNVSKDGSSLLWEIPPEENQFQLDEENISFIIPKDGRYFVYSQVTFSCSRCNCEEGICCGKKAKGAKTVWQKIGYKTVGYPEPNDLIISISSINETKSLKSLYLARIMLLTKGDKLLVYVSNPAMVQADIRYTFFGAYFIS